MAGGWGLPPPGPPRRFWGFQGVEVRDDACGTLLLPELRYLPKPLEVKPISQVGVRRSLKQRCGPVEDPVVPYPISTATCRPRTPEADWDRVAVLDTGQIGYTDSGGMMCRFSYTTASIP